MISKNIDKSISVVIPVYNSEKTIGELIEKLKATLSCFSTYQIILINDNSQDNSYQTIKKYADNEENIIAINLYENVGQQLATFLGLKYAKGDYIIVLDDDFAHNPDDILLLYGEIEKGYEVVYAINKIDARNSLLRNSGSKIRDIMINAITSKPKNIYVSSFRIINKKINQKIITANSRFIYISLEILKHTNNIGNIDVKYMQVSPSNYTIKRLASLIWNMYIYYSKQKIFKLQPLDEGTFKFDDIINGDRI